MTYTQDPIASSARLVRWPWAGLALLTVAFLAFSVPPYVTLDPMQARLPIPDGYPWYYTALVGHILFGTIALLTACVQLWPWLRTAHPRIHRLSGRIYVLGGALPASVVVLTITPFGMWGANQQVANTMLALLWFATTVAGYRAARARRYAAHREWMVRSTALAFSIVANRFWSITCVLVFAPDAIGVDGTLVPTAELAQAIGVSTWLSWVVNLIAAEWWLHRTRHTDRTAPTPPGPRRREDRTRGSALPPERALGTSADARPPGPQPAQTTGARHDLRAS